MLSVAVKEEESRKILQVGASAVMIDDGEFRGSRPTQRAATVLEVQAVRAVNVELAARME